MSKNFISRIDSIDIDKLIELKKTNKLLCLYDSKLNSLDKYLIASNKLDIGVLNNLTTFVSNKNSLTKSPIIILNKLSQKSLDIIKSDFVLKLPQKYNISVIFVGTESEYDLVYGFPSSLKKN